MTTNHPAHGPVSLDRLRQISEILSKAAVQSDGGNIGYAMADAVKVINEVLECRKAGKCPITQDGYVMVPKKLTAENGAKGELSGEFSETKFINCPECFGEDECETCDGSGRLEITVPVTWTTIKAIWDKGVEHFEALYDIGYIPGPPFFATTAGEFHPTHWMPLPAAPHFREISNSSTNNCRENAKTSTNQASLNSNVTIDCWCHTCRPVTMSDMRFVVCPDCGNKRCPHANDHRNACTGSNEPGQIGSAYPAAPQQEVK
ncbi:TPA: DUF551 domain-containing protein [Citrobacter freundii]|uniref:DUF551 domain-containing protein n=1 Tax=Citrobacter freundii TaxID=546 RepID=UPI00215B5D22|nr:DUF551 domain-containing protein [Citrobacter freundii]